MMATDTDIVDVIYRVDREGHVFALFPGLAGTNDLKTCTCFEVNGGHSSADLAWCIKTSRPAREDEVEHLHKVLTINYGYLVNVVKNVTRLHLRQRARQL